MTPRRALIGVAALLAGLVALAQPAAAATVSSGDVSWVHQFHSDNESSGYGVTPEDIALTNTGDAFTLLHQDSSFTYRSTTISTPTALLFEAANGTDGWTMAIGGNDADNVHMAGDHHGAVYLWGNVDDGGVSLGGTTYLDGGGDRMFVAKVTSSGTVDWTQTLHADTFTDVVVSPDGNDVYLLGGNGGPAVTVGSLSLALPDVEYEFVSSFIAQLDATDGTPNWAHWVALPGDGSSAYAWTLAADNDGAYVHAFVWGQADIGTTSFDSGTSTFVQANVAVSDTGSIRWAVEDSAAESVATYVTSRAAGGVAVAHQDVSTNAVDVVELDTDGTVVASEQISNKGTYLAGLIGRADGSLVLYGCVGGSDEITFADSTTVDPGGDTKALALTVDGGSLTEVDVFGTNRSCVEAMGDDGTDAYASVYVLNSTATVLGTSIADTPVLYGTGATALFHLHRST